MESSDYEYISDEEEYIPQSRQNQQKNIKSVHNQPNTKFKPRFQQHGNQRPANQSKKKFNFHQSKNVSSEPISPIKYDATSRNSDSYDTLRSKILACFSEGVIIPLMNITLIYSEKYTTMFDFKNGSCLKGRFHNHKTILKYFTCCTDTFTILKLKMDFIKRTDKQISELIQKRLDQHLFKVSKNSPDRLMHLEMLIITLFASKTTVTVEDLEMIFFDVYRIKLISLFPSDRPLRKSLQLINSPNMRVSVTQKADNVICVPPFHKDFYEYREKIDNYNRVLVIEDKICRKEYIQPISKDSPTAFTSEIKTPLVDLLKKTRLSDFQVINSPENVKISENVHPQSNNDLESKESKECKESKKSENNIGDSKISQIPKSQIEYLLSLTNLNIPKNIQKSDITLPTPAELYKNVKNETFIHCLLNLNLDQNENQPLTKNLYRKEYFNKNDIHEK
ncbi:hypothetical protein M153_2100028674 [Pseudoloma neurophilia]|uniref:Uncharacterized protein n=1 Tax=Pseudoloma neurophilia TaxID=146866 RepID=A0A0R0M130_9MICR|nr:hypothetical protein M153_2100028674 [Pseudoloma neurophilia]